MFSAHNTNILWINICEKKTNKTQVSAEVLQLFLFIIFFFHVLLLLQLPATCDVEKSLVSGCYEVCLWAFYTCTCTFTPPPLLSSQLSSFSSRVPLSTPLPVKGTQLNLATSIFTKRKLNSYMFSSGAAINDYFHNQLICRLFSRSFSPLIYPLIYKMSGQDPKTFSLLYI